MKNVCFVAAVALVFALIGGLPAAFASKAQPIGRITYVDKKFWGMRISGGGGDRDAALDGKIYEHDIVQTVAGQHLVVLLEDGTELIAGPSTRLEFRNWSERDSEGHRTRLVWMTTGMIKAKVRKIYSQLEPFVIANRNGVVAVRGTEFVVEAGSGGRLGRSGDFSEQEKTLRIAEIEVHTLEGEVHLARTMQGLADASSRVAVAAGQTSLVRAAMLAPQQPHAFDLSRFTRYLAKAAPGVDLKIDGRTNNTQRSETAENVKLKTSTASPAYPGYASATKAESAGRSIASEPAATAALAHDSHERRKKMGFDRAPSTVAAPNGELTTDGVHDALLGGNVQDAADHDSTSLAQQTGARIDRNRVLNTMLKDPKLRVPYVDPSTMRPTGAAAAGQH